MLCVEFVFKPRKHMDDVVEQVMTTKNPFTRAQLKKLHALHALQVESHVRVARIPS